MTFVSFIIDLVKNWELRLIMLFSLLLQILLVTLGSRWRFVQKLPPIRILLWCAFKMGDSVATVGLGVISNLLSDMQRENGSVGPDGQLMALWSSILFLHLAGPDTITAYSWEEHEQWLSHLVKLLVPLGVSGYIYFMFLASTSLSFVALTIILIGLVKYVERTLSLYLTGKNQLLESSNSMPRPLEFLIYPWDLKRQYAGSEIGEPDKTIMGALKTFDDIKTLFINGVLRERVVQRIKSQLEKNKVFRIVEIELGLIKELIYTKVLILMTGHWGIFSRAATILAFAIVLVVSCVRIIENDKVYYNSINVAITVLLVTMSFLLELLSFLVILSSQWSASWPCSRSLIHLLENISGKPKWVCSKVAQFSLIGFSMRKNPSCLQKMPKVVANLVRKLQEHFASTHKDLDAEYMYMQEWIYCRVEEKMKDLDDDNVPASRIMSSVYQVEKLLEGKGQGHLGFDTCGESQVDFDQTIIIWHIATEICYYFDHKDMSSAKVGAKAPMNNYKMSKIISRYMLYLLIVYPAMLAIDDTNKFRYIATLDDAQRFFRKYSIGKEVGDRLGQCSSCTLKHKRERGWFLCKASQMLLCHELYTTTEERLDRNNSGTLLHEAIRLAMQLNEMHDHGAKWKMIADVWGEVLLFAAVRSVGEEHAKSLSQGQELLTHVWLLMAHGGITKQIE